MMQKPPFEKPVVEQWVDIGLREQQAGRPAEGEKWFRAVLGHVPNHFDALQLLGLARIQQGDQTEGIRWLSAALAVRPNEAFVCSNLAQALRDTGQTADAYAMLRRAHALDPSDVDVARNLALAELDLENYIGARQLLEDAIRRAPNRSSLYVLLFQTLQHMGLSNDALLALARAVELDPTDGNARFDLGVAFSAMSNHEAALEAFRDAKPWIPADLEAATAMSIAYEGLAIADWSDWSTLMARLRIPFDGTQRSLNPFKLMHLPIEPQQVAHAAALHAVRPERTFGAETFTRPAAAALDGRVRIAYLSPDLRDHPVGRLVAPVIENHDRSAFDIHVIAWAGADDRVAPRIQRAAEHFVDASALTDRAVAQYLIDAHIDIAIDLAGVTLNERPRIFSARAARIQASWLGYAATQGSAEIPYFISDVASVESPSAQGLLEAVVRLPDLAMAFDTETPISDPPSRSSFGLPEDAIVLASFAQTRKLIPDLFDAWLAVLRQVPQALLWLRDPGVIGRGYLMRHAIAAGVDITRLRFAEQVPDYSAYLARHRAADIVLDTFPYGSHSSALDALAAGVPLVSLRGPMLASRISSSALVAAGLPDLITESFDEHRDLLVRLCRHPDQLASIRRRLSENRATAPAFDPIRLTRQLESAYRTMVERDAAGLPPASFDVPRF